MTLEKKIEKPLNIILKNKYPFIKEIEVSRLTHIFFELRADINIIIPYEFIEEHVDYSCYDQMDKTDIFFSLYSFNYCSDVKIDEGYFYDTVKTIYKMRALSTSSVYAVNLSLSVIGEL
jgi:hypothetical protein